MRFSIGILASVLLFNAVYAQESSSASASFSVESVSYQKRDFFDFLTIFFPDDKSSSASVEEIEPSSSGSSSASDEAEPSLADAFEKRDGNMQEVLESLANFYYASASLESAAMSIAREEWSANPEEVASVIVQASRQHKARYMKRDEDDEDSVSASASFEEEASSIVEEDAFAPVSQAYLPVYYRRAKRHLELRDLGDDIDETDSSISEVPDEEPSAYYHNHHHHEESVSNHHYQEQASAEYYEAADNLEKRDEVSVIEEDASSSIDSAESSLEDVASKIAQDVQDQIDRALGKGKVAYSEQEPMVAESLEDQVWVDDEEQFKGYDWAGSN